MFGCGLYFACKAKKSINYTSLKGSYWANGNSNTGLLAVYKVAAGNPYDVYAHESKYYTFNENNIKNLKKDSIWGHTGISLKNDEIVVYNEAAATIQYLIELN